MRFKTMLTAALVVAGLAATSQAASAAPATWNPGGGTPVTMKGNLTMTQYGLTYTCANFTWQVVVSNGGPSGNGAAGPLAYNNCVRAGVTSRMTTIPGGYSEVNGGVYSLRTFGTNLGFPGLGGGMFVQTSAVVPFINGSGSTPSRLAFNNTHIGDGIHVTGTLDVKVTATGGLVTLS